MPSLFSRIVKGELPCHKVLEDEKHLAFLDLNPVNPGHTLVIPKKEVDYFFDLDDDALAGLVVFSKKAARALKLAVPCKKTGVMVAGLEVPHAHVHLVPILENLSELTFARARRAAPEELAAMAQRIKSKL